MTQKDGANDAPARPAKSASRAGEALSKPPSGGDPSSQVDNLFKDWGGDYKTPGAAVLVMQDGKVLHEKGYGLTEVGGLKLGPQTVFELASVSKQFTAMAVMLLKQEGKLDYSDRLGKYFNFRALEANEVTVLQLLDHRSGLPEYGEVFAAANLIDKHFPRSAKADRGRFEPTVDDVLKSLAEQYEFAFAPGARYSYSNSGYVLLSKIVEKVSGQAFPAFMRERIFKPLGMESSFIYEKSSPVPAEAALGHDRGWTVFNEIDYTPLDFIYGDGSVQTNLSDMRKWVLALDELSSASRGDKGGKLPVTRATFKEALKKAEETDTPGVSYGFGWFLGKARGLDGVWHSGSWGGYRTMIMRFPSQKFTVVVLSNVAHLMPTFMAAKVSTFFLEGVMERPRTPPVTKEILARFAKRYTDDSGDYYDVTLEPEAGGKHALFLKYSTLDKFKLVPVRGDGGKFRGEFFIEGLFGFDAFRYTLDERRNVINVPSRPKGPAQNQRRSFGRRSKF